MKFFVDSADVEEIGELSETGLIDGVTTNPSSDSQIRAQFFRRCQRDLLNC